ncbi:MAG: hypothetical protein DME24_06455 [Verrucomicrobia bacterium]|nr:MAG: hypothetical protein DME24_06455 [Verrucomicrobiota bacterium]
MRTWLAFFVFAFGLASEAHIGSPNVFFEGKAGEYFVRAVIRPPQVVPGLAEITLRVPGEPVERVMVLPVFSKAGRQGAPPPDEARLVRGETNLYTAALWLMKPGAYSVDVTIEGSRGRGTLILPVNSMATNTRPMSRGLGIVLSALAVLLFLGALKIAGAIFGESRLEPGARPTKKDQWRGRGAMGLAAGVLALLAFGGKLWWDIEDANYRTNALYRPLPVLAQARTERDQQILTIKVDSAERRGQWTPLIPDHGKMMHLFLVRDGEPGAFAHLHPARRNETEFEAPLPPLPAGPYHVYADVTHEDGFAETLTATAEIPPASLAMKRLWLGDSAEPICSLEVAQKLATNLFLPPDADDSWQMDNAERGDPRPGNNYPHDPVQHVVDAGGGYKMIWENPGPFMENHDISLRVRLLAPDNQPALLEPYLGMLGHAVVRRQDGTVFAHVHPVGTFSMAAQEFFVKGMARKGSALTGQPHQSPEEQQSSAGELHRNHTKGVGTAGEVSFPYAFPKSGPYRIWVQTKSEGRILTGVFDTTVAAAK